VEAVVVSVHLPEVEEVQASEQILQQVPHLYPSHPIYPPGSVHHLFELMHLT
jgi:hypothetical protein